MHPWGCCNEMTLKHLPVVRGDYFITACIRFLLSRFNKPRLNSPRVMELFSKNRHHLIQQILGLHFFPCQKNGDLNVKQEHCVLLWGYRAPLKATKRYFGVFNDPLEELRSPSIILELIKVIKCNWQIWTWKAASVGTSDCRFVFTTWLKSILKLSHGRQTVTPKGGPKKTRLVCVEQFSLWNSRQIGLVTLCGWWTFRPVTTTSKQHDVCLVVFQWLVVLCEDSQCGVNSASVCISLS